MTTHRSEMTRPEIKTIQIAVQAFFTLLCVWTTSSTYITSAPALSIPTQRSLGSNGTHFAHTMPHIYDLPKHIECFEPAQGRLPPTIDGCRPTLNEIRKWPKYRVVQRFEVDKWPKEPSTPPFSLHHHASDCLILIATTNPEVTDRFSFAEVRGNATEILEECHPSGAIGGIASMGTGIGWTVTVFGIRDIPSLSLKTNTTLLLDRIRSEVGMDVS